MIFVDELAHFQQVVLFAHTERRQRTSAGESAMNHHSRELFETHSLDQVRSADLCRQPPVLVGIQFAVSIEILEPKSIHRKQRCGSVPDGWLLRFVSHSSG
jgi:hypothetical protein